MANNKIKKGKNNNIKKNNKQKKGNIKGNTTNNKKGKSKKQIILIAIMMFCILFFLLTILFGLYIIISSPKFSKDQLYNKELSVMYDINGDEYAELGSENRELVTYEDLPEVLIDAIVATEDSRFFQHNGFDIARFVKASLGQAAGQNAGGASTLTMQVVKNTFTSTESHGIKGIIRKFTDIYMSIFKVEKNYTKEQIMEFYVNAPYLGNSSYGVEAASQSYFGKSVSDLTLTEAALIAGLYQAPHAYDPYNNPEAATNRRATVLSLMRKHGYITKEQQELANSISIQSLLLPKDQVKDNNINQGFVDTVVEEVIKKTGNNPYDVPMLIYTTMDPKGQSVLNGIMNGESFQFVNDEVQMGITITSVKDGSIVAVGAGRNRVGERQYNYATMIKRHPGSAAKPFFAYGPLIEYNNASPATYFFDLPYSYSNGQSVSNADKGHRGIMNMKTALASSRNIPAIQAFQQVDKEKISEFAHNVGIDYGKELFESAAIGAFDGVSPLQMSAAYATLARGGEYIEPYSFTKIVYRENNKEYINEIKKKQAMSDSTAYLLTYILNYAIENNKILGSLSVGNTQVAGKTGTSTIDGNALKKYHLPSSAIMDSWANLYTSDYAASIWYGYKEVKENRYLTATTGDRVRKKISQIIANNYFNTGAKFNVPSSVVKAEYELYTFPLTKPTENTPESLRGYEYFKAGAEPEASTISYSKLDTPTNLKANEAGSTISISWDPINAPVGNTQSGIELYEKYFGKYASKFYNAMAQYNSTKVGTIGYNITVKDPTGNTTDLGFTTNTNYTYAINSGNGSYTFNIRAVYSSSSKGGSDITTAIVKVSNQIDENTESDDTSCNGNEFKIISPNVYGDTITLSAGKVSELNTKIKWCGTYTLTVKDGSKILNQRDELSAGKIYGLTFTSTDAKVYEYKLKIT